MENEPAEYRKLALKQFPPRALRETAEGKYWKRFAKPVNAQQAGAVSHISFTQQYPYNFAVTTSTRVIIYDAVTRQVRRQFTRFKDKAYCGTFRADNKLLVAGGEDGIVQVFDAGSRTLLRQLKAHKRAAHVAHFSPDRMHVLSAADDTTVRWWDVTVGKQDFRLDGHSDYVRSAAVSPSSPDTWATAGYDHICKLWDVRSQECTMNLDHGAPIEDVKFFPSGGLAVTAGGTSLCVWDIMAGGRLLQRLSQHQKTVTCVVLSPLAGPDSAAAPCMLSGSLDGHVKVYELDTFKVTHASKYPGPVLSLGIAPDCSLLAVGQADGQLSIRKHATPKVVPVEAGGRPARKQRYKPQLTAASYRYFIRGQSDKAAAADFKVAKRKRIQLKAYDKLLKSFQYREALDAALAGGRPEVITSLVQELAIRSGLPAALGGRDVAGLLPLLQCLVKFLVDPRYSRLLLGVAHRVLNTYSGEVGVSAEVDKQLTVLRERVVLELRLHSELQQIQGMLEPILASSLGNAASQSKLAVTDELRPL
ncbi:hypothetical protein ABBQ38_010492 [Trebouxia sp. C0009 RCD-2024]